MKPLCTQGLDLSQQSYCLSFRLIQKHPTKSAFYGAFFTLDQLHMSLLEDNSSAPDALNLQSYTLSIQTHRERIFVDEIDQLRKEKELLHLQKEVKALKKTDRVLWIIFSIMFVIGLMVTSDVRLWGDQLRIGQLVVGILLCVPLLIKMARK